MRPLGAAEDDEADYTCCDRVHRQRQENTRTRTHACWLASGWKRQGQKMSAQRLFVKEQRTTQLKKTWEPWNATVSDRRLQEMNAQRSRVDDRLEGKQDPRATLQVITPS